MARKDREVMTEYKSKCDELRNQLAEQLRCIEFRLEVETSMLTELQDFYKRRAEVEERYAADLRKLVDNHIERTKSTDKSKQAQWSMYSTFKLWQTLLGITMDQSHQHQILGEVYASKMVPRFVDCADDSRRLHARCQDMCLACHRNLFDLLAKLLSNMKEYRSAHAETIQQERRLKLTESEKKRLEELSTSKSAEKNSENRKLRQVEKAYDKRYRKYSESKQRALATRNEYLLCLESVNSSIGKHFADELPDILDCLACGYHNSLARAVMMQINCENVLRAKRENYSEMLMKCVTDLDARRDKNTFLQINSSAFSKPRRFAFDAHPGDEIEQVTASNQNALTQLQNRLINLRDQLEKLRCHTEEQWKTLETAEKSWMNQINVEDYEVQHLFNKTLQQNKELMESSFVSAGSDGSFNGSFGTPSGTAERSKKTSLLEQRRIRLLRKWETGEFYLTKFSEYMHDNNQYACLQAKYLAIQRALGGKDAEGVGRGKPPDVPKKPKRGRILKAPLVGQPKLFAGTIDEYTEAMNQEIPLIVESCIRVINMYGMQLQGIFRVSGSQAEIIEFKKGFEQGGDPLTGVCDARDINSTCGVLKLYFRELAEPLFPSNLFDDFIDCSKEKSTENYLQKVIETLKQVTKPTYRVMRYLFAFLHHLSEYADENMMDPLNLAICFGPTLMPTPVDRDQVLFQSAVNDIVKTIIIYHERCFCRDDVHGKRYDKFQADFEEADTECQDLENVSDTEDDQLSASDGRSFSYSESNSDVVSQLQRQGSLHSTASSSISATLVTVQQLAFLRNSSSSSGGTRDSHHSRQASADSLLSFASNLSVASTPSDGGMHQTAEPESYRVTAKFDFHARSDRELPFLKGDILIVYSRVNADWLQGVHTNGNEGLIPNAYVVPTNVFSNQESDSQSAICLEPKKSRFQDNANITDIKELPPSAPFLDESLEAVVSPLDAKSPFMLEATECLNTVDSSKTISAYFEDKDLAVDEIEDHDKDHDIDIALKEVMEGLESLTQSTNNCTTSNYNSLTLKGKFRLPGSLYNSCSLERKFRLPASKHTPDLVLDLPAQSAQVYQSLNELESADTVTCALSPSVVNSISTSASSAMFQHLGYHSTVADTFAAHDSQDTLKKAAPTALLQLRNVASSTETLHSAPMPTLLISGQADVNESSVTTIADENNGSDSDCTSTSGTSPPNYNYCLPYCSPPSRSPVTGSPQLLCRNLLKSVTDDDVEPSDLNKAVPPKPKPKPKPKTKPIL